MNFQEWVQIEKRIVNFWKSANIFEKLLTQNRRNRKFVFYEGPPYANAKPHMGHFLTRTFKDVILRFRGFLGEYVPRRAGWDTHGLPIEVATEKELGFRNKKEVVAYGVDKFNQKCKELVTKYKSVWEEMDERMGFWIDHQEAYITFDPFYMESCWWIVKQIYQKGYLKEELGVVPYCPRCETVLSKAELGMPDAYRKVKDPSVFVKFKLEGKDEFVLVWTTTPWTLPGNLAIAVNPKETYYLFQTDQGKIWAHQKLSEEILQESKGKELVGLGYQPIFQPLKKISKNNFKIYAADFVDVTEGTGFVHIAPAYGEDDFLLGKKYKLDLINYLDDQGRFQDGHFKPLNDKLTGQFFKEADVSIFQYLKDNGFLYQGSLSSYEHEYPHCWRCKTPLIYQARKSWVIKASLAKDKLLQINEKVNWWPKEIGQGRFGSWLEEGKDWHVSRTRFWGIPMPIWRCSQCHKTEVIGSLQDLAKKTKANNNYYLMRHAEAYANTKSILSSYPEKIFNPLTSKGLLSIKKVLPKIKKFKIDLIISSPILRAKETAFHLAEKLNVAVEIDERLREIDLGVLNGEKEEKYHQLVKSQLEQYYLKPEGGENLQEVTDRMIKVILDLEEKYSGKNILIISHKDPLWALAGEMLALSPKEVAKRDDLSLSLAEVKKVNYLVVPRDQSGRINLHRPYVDKFTWRCQCGGEFRRIEEILDIWFDSGSMPFASFHYPFENKNEIDQGKLYPADIIAEGLDQTRGWFYTLLVLGYLLKKQAPYKNVLVNGLVLDEKGIKMSKSLGNVVDPIEMMEKYGADVMRFYLIQMNDPWLDKNFSEKELVVLWQNLFLFLHNIYRFYRFYDHPKKKQIKNLQKNELDLWFEARLKEVKLAYLENLQNYQLTKAARLVSEIIADLSKWWIRRSRERFQNIYRNGDRFSLSSLRLLENYLLEILLLLASFAPFTAEYLYQELKYEFNQKPKESIHLLTIQKPNELSGKEKKLLQDMQIVREVASEINRIRKEKQIRTRQPLKTIYLEKKIPLSLLWILQEEINVKKIVFGKPKEGNFSFLEKPIKGWLDLTLTEELIHEGIFNDLCRQIQTLRQAANLTPKEIVKLKISGSNNFLNYLKARKNILFQETRTKLSFEKEKKILAEKEIILGHFGKINLILFR